MRLSRVATLSTRFISLQLGRLNTHLINPPRHEVCCAFRAPFRTFSTILPPTSHLFPATDTSTAAKSYQDAVAALNSLQSNAQATEEAPKERDQNATKNLQSMATLLKHLDIRVSDLDKLHIIHVSGTDGKGSTCAFAESLMRHVGNRTGLFSSRHLVSVRERIRLLGKPISEDLFTKYFWEIYDRLAERCAPEDMPSHCEFLTLMGFYVFIKEKVDVVIMEAGIGGTDDSTNIIRGPVVCGVTSLGLDHTSLLGDTLPQIAAHRAGIFKPNSVAVTVDQPSDAIAVLQNRANSLDIPLYTVRALKDYPTKDKAPLRLGMQGHIQSINASLAMQLVCMWMMRRNISGPVPPYHDANKLVPFLIDETLRAALESCSWPGRFQRFTKGNAQYYLDEAHAKDTVKCCAEWYKSVRNSGRNLKRYVLFNATADRSPDDLLQPLMDCNFDMALFCPSLLDKDLKATSDLANFAVSSSQQQNRCLQHAEAWKRLAGTGSGNGESRCFESVRDVFDWLEKQDGPVEVLVTGSVQLVGAALTILDPSLGGSL